MRSRLELHKILTALLGSSNVYFQPPPSVMLNYPCIVYSRDNTHRLNSDNHGYVLTKRYSVIHISKNPDDTVPDKLVALPHCSHANSYSEDNLHHHAFSLYF